MESNQTSWRNDGKEVRDKRRVEKKHIKQRYGETVKEGEQENERVVREGK